MFMKPCPFTHETPRSRGPEFPGKKLSREIERCQLPLLLEVKMRWIVIIKKHSNDDPKKR